MLRKNQRVQTLATAASREIALAEAFSVEFGFGILFAGLIHGRVGQTQDDPPDHAQNQRGVRGPHPAQVLLQAHVQAVVQAAFNHPVLALELEQAPRLQLCQTQAADQIDHFARPGAVALDAGLQPGD